jgi:precorrin-6B methylase 2
MKQAILDRVFPREREFQPVNHGLFRGCEMYLSMRDQFHLCYGTYEREIAEHFARLAQDCGSFIDIGAGEGCYSVYMMRNTSAKVFAFEAAGESRALLMNNLARNGDGEGRSMVSHRRLDAAGDDDEEEESSVMDLDSIAKRLTGPVFLHINDVENPVAVLKGAGKVLAMVDGRVIVEVHAEETEAECAKFLEAAGYQMEIVGSAWWRKVIRDGRKAERNQWIVAEKVAGLEA